MNFIDAGVSLRLPMLLILLVSIGACASLDSSPRAAAPASAWVLAWSDEFDAAEIDPHKWQQYFDCSDHGNNEAQCYTDRARNAYVDSNGILHIVAREETFSGPAHAPDHVAYNRNDSSKTKAYTSARLSSKNRFDFKYGRIEVRARLAGGQGMWPAIWLLPTDWVYGGWPSSGEIDIMEAVSLDTPGKPNEVHGSMNYGLKWPQWSATGRSYQSPRSFTAKFHTFLLEWEADEIRWFVDGIHYQTQTADNWYNYIWGGQQQGFIVANPRAPYDQNFHLLLNLAVGGHWPGQPDKNWRAERELLVDYVRVYQCGSGNADGTGCASAPDALVDTSIQPTPDGGAPRVNRFPLFEHGPATLKLQAGGNTITNQLVIGRQAASADAVVIDTVDIGGAHGEVLDIRFSAPASVSLSSADMRAFTGVTDGFNLIGGSAWSNYGTLEFDLFVENIDSTTTLMAGLVSGPKDLGQYSIETPAAGQWTHVAIRLADLLVNPLPGGKGLDPNHVTSLLRIAATGTAKAHIRLDNIFLSCAVNAYSKNWQWDTSCSIAALASSE
jgi:beta-glucanase (GH16 family)